MAEFVLIKDLPQELIAEVTSDVAQYTIGFLSVETTGNRPNPKLLGSGVLVSAGPTRAILTAHHVLEALPKTGRLGLMLQRTHQPHTIDRNGVAVLEIARGAKDSAGPDLGAVVLAPAIAGSIAAMRPFYNLDTRRNELLQSPPGLRDGFWIAQGFLEERTTTTTDLTGGVIAKGFYNFSGVGSPESVDEVGEFDYLEFPVSYGARDTSPQSWGGMSGGGLWQIPIKREKKEVVALKPLLSGILFYQNPTTNTECGVKGHGRRSIYQSAYNAIRGGGP